MFNLDKIERAVIVFLLALLLLFSFIKIYNAWHPVAFVRVDRHDADAWDKKISLLNNPPKININEADTESLMGIKGIGKVIAERIINYRDERGYFYSIEDLKKIKGLGSKVVDKIKDNITTD